MYAMVFAQRWQAAEVDRPTPPNRDGNRYAVSKRICMLPGFAGTNLSVSAHAFDTRSSSWSGWFGTMPTKGAVNPLTLA